VITAERQATFPNRAADGGRYLGRHRSHVVGDFAAGDEKTFMNKVGTPATPEKVIVTLMSNDDQFYPAIVIGDFIRLTGLA
jgi:hypothetical protein